MRMFRAAWPARIDEPVVQLLLNLADYVVFEITLDGEDSSMRGDFADVRQRPSAQCRGNVGSQQLTDPVE